MGLAPGERSGAAGEAHGSCSEGAAGAFEQETAPARRWEEKGLCL